MSTELQNWMIYRSYSNSGSFFFLILNIVWYSVDEVLKITVGIFFFFFSELAVTSNPVSTEDFNSIKS